MARRSQRVDTAIKSCWAKLADEAFKRALTRVRVCDDPDAADPWMGKVEEYLDRAGAEATRWNFHG